MIIYDTLLLDIEGYQIIYDILLMDIAGYLIIYGKIMIKHDIILYY